jgi:hypothetical protein
MQFIDQCIAVAQSFQNSSSADGPLQGEEDKRDWGKGAGLKGLKGLKGAFANSSSSSSSGRIGAQKDGSTQEQAAAAASSSSSSSDRIMQIVMDKYADAAFAATLEAVAALQDGSATCAKAAVEAAVAKRCPELFVNKIGKAAIKPGIASAAAAVATVAAALTGPQLLGVVEASQTHQQQQQQEEPSKENFP